MVLTAKILAVFFIYFLFSKWRFLIGINTVLRSVPRVLTIRRVLCSEITIQTKLGIIMSQKRNFDPQSNLKGTQVSRVVKNKVSALARKQTVRCKDQ